MSNGLSVKSFHEETPLPPPPITVKILSLTSRVLGSISEKGLFLISPHSLAPSIIAFVISSLRYSTFFHLYLKSGVVVS